MPSPQELEPKDLGIKEIPTVPEIPPEVEKGTGTRVINKTFTAQIRSDKGVPLIQTPPVQVITVTPPASQSTLIAWAKGPITASISWLGMFWLRIIKKALFFGWKISGKEEK